MDLHVISYPLLASIMVLIIYVILHSRLRRFSLDLLAFLLVIVSYVLYIRAFVTDDFTLREVFSYSNKGMQLWLKVAASWAGVGGSFLLWTFLMVLIAIGYRFYYWKKGFFDIKTMRMYYILIIFLEVLVLAGGTFEVIRAPYELVTGIGLNPILRSFWMLIHPLFTFAGYAFSLAFAVEILVSERRSKVLERIFASLAWLNLSIGIISGAVWAYSVLGWGGYWAWDPVETAELVPWLTLTAYFHTLQFFGRGGIRLTAALTGFYTLYSSFMTKAGAQFTASVHTFQWTPTSYFLIVLHFVLGLIFMALYVGDQGEFTFIIKRNLTNLSFVLAWSSLILLSLICFIGIFSPVAYAFVTGSLLSVGPQYYNMSSVPFTYLFLIALVGCCLRKLIKLKQYGYIVIFILTSSFVLIFLKMPTDHWMANFLIPAALTGLIAALLNLFFDLKSKKTRFIGISLIHFSIPLILFGVALNSTLTSSTIIQAPIGEFIETPYGFSIQFNGFSIRPSEQVIFYKGHLMPEGAFGDFYFKLRFSDKEVDVSIPARAFFVYGCGSEPKIVPRGINEIYISLIHADLHNRLKSIIIDNAFFGGNYRVDFIYIEVKYNPYIGLVWAGCIIIILGEVIAITAFILREKLGVKV